MLRMPQVRHEYIEMLIRKVYQAYVKNDTQIVEPFVLKLSFQKSLLNIQLQILQNHLLCILHHHKHFIFSNSYIHKHLHILDLATCTPTFYRLHHQLVSFQHQLKCNIQGQKVYKNLKKIAYVKIVSLNFYA